MLESRYQSSTWWQFSSSYSYGLSMPSVLVESLLTILASDDDGTELRTFLLKNGAQLSTNQQEIPRRQGDQWKLIQFRHVIPAPADRLFACAWLVVDWLLKHSLLARQDNKACTYIRAPKCFYMIHCRVWSVLFSDDRGWLGAWLFLMPGLPTHLLQEIMSALYNWIRPQIKKTFWQNLFENIFKLQWVLHVWMGYTSIQIHVT